ncbi:MAG: response regulator transcription factor [Anaerolineaceae bacterium]
MNPDSGPLRILVSAAYPALRAGLRAMLDASPGLTVVGEFASASETAEVELSAADILVADVRDEAAIAALAGLADGIGIVFLASEPGWYGALENRPPQPRALLLEGATAEELAAAVFAVSHGLLVIDPAVAAALAHEHPYALGELAGGPPTPLTTRETAVLTLVASGLPNKTIALRLGISDHTVKFHVGSILGKLGAASRTEAVTLAVRSGLLPL